MERRDLMRKAGAAGILALMPWRNAFATKPAGDLSLSDGNCALIPQETEGPYPLDTVSNADLLRQDIRESKEGVQLNVKMKIIGLENCVGMPNVWVKIWHCDADGYYSGYTNQGYIGTQNNQNEDWLRGVQITDANGEVEFISIFPGWYTSRVTHIHFRVYISSVLTATSQFTFPIETKNAIYTSNSLYSTHGTDPQDISSDNVFSDGYNLQMATLTENTSTGGWDSYIEVTINGTGTAGLAALEPETGGQFKLLQNYPNPYQGSTTVPFILNNASDVELEILDLSGKKIASVRKKNMAAGEYQWAIGNGNNGIGLKQANYIYQLVVSNSHGTYRQCKVMTAAN